MTIQNELEDSLRHKSLAKRVLQGACIAFILVTIFLSVMFSLGEVLIGQGFWQGVWEFFPLVTATVGGGFGGMIYYMLVQLWNPRGWRKVVATIVSTLVYIVLVWVSLIAGFSVTGKWD